VQLAFETAGGPPQMRHNAHASVIVYTGEHPVANALAWLMMRPQDGSSPPDVARVVR
jgi:hypothetical protein